MKKYAFFIYIIFLNQLINIICQESKDTQSSSCDNIEDSKNKFILKTDLTQKEIEQIFSKNFSIPTKNEKKQSKRHKNNINMNNNNIKEFKSNDDLNKTIFLLEINSNIKELKNENKINNESYYELIDAKNNNDTKIFLSFDKFFTVKYKEMFEYSYTIIIFCVILIIIIIYYTFILPNEASDWNINSPISNDSSRKNRGTNFGNEYILKDNDF